MDLSFDEIRKTVFDAKPVFARILAEHGNETLAGYFGKTVSAPTVSEERKAEFLEVFGEQVSRVLGTEIAAKAVSDFSRVWSVSTADHHGPLTHPFFGNSALVRANSASIKKEGSIFVFSCGGISMDNSSFPRGFLMHDGSGEEVRLRLVSRTESNRPEHSRPAYKVADAWHLEHSLAISTLSEDTKNSFRQHVLSLCMSNGALTLPWYADQMTWINFHMWKKVPGSSGVDLVYIEQETLVSELLRRKHIGHDTLISRLLFDEVFLNAYEEHMDGIMGAHSRDAQRGSFLWWGIENGNRISLQRGDTRIASPEAVLKGLENRTLMPTMALTFIVLAFYYGIECGGGFSQVNYLEDMKQAYLNILSRVGSLASEADYVQTCRTDSFMGEFVLATLGTAQQKVAATPQDLIVYGDLNTADKIAKQIQTIALRDAVDGIMPELYKIVTGRAVPKEVLARYTPSTYEETTLPLLRE